MAYLRIVELADGKAQAITDAVFEFCQEWELDIDEQFCRLGSDGDAVSVM